MGDRPRFVAVSEDEPIVWLERTCSRLAAIRAGAEECCGPARHFWARPRYMREATRELDCPVWPHGEDEDGERPDDCNCSRIEEGWLYQCGADEPGAIPVWRVYERPGRRRLRRRWIKIADQLIWRRRSYAGRKSVLWGGSVGRRANRFDRFLGYPGVVLLGDNWLKPEPLEWRYCDVCGCKTPRRANGTTRFARRCLAEAHGDRDEGPLR